MRAREFTNFTFDIEPYEVWNGEGVIVHAYDGKDEIGHVIFEPTEDDATQWYAVDVEVEEPYQRKGIATKMYDMAKKAAKSAGAIIVKSHAQTDAGRGLWQDKLVWETSNPTSPEQLDELFQQGKRNWTWKRRTEDEAVANFTVGDRSYVWQAFSHHLDDKPNKWEVQFRLLRQPSDPEKLSLFGTTGTGNSSEVLSTAVDIMREFLQYYGERVQELTFDAKENSRITLYRKMIQRLLPNWNLDEDYSSDYGLRFTLTRPKQM